MKMFIFEQYQIDDGEVKSGEGRIDYDMSKEYAEIFSSDSRVVRDFKDVFRNPKKSKYYFYGEQGELGINLMAQMFNSGVDEAYMGFKTWR